MGKVKLLQLITGLGTGGAEKVVLDLCDNLDKSKFDVSVISLGTRREMLHLFENKKIAVIVLGLKKSLFGFFAMISKVNTFVKQNNVSVIHAHMTHPVIIASFIKILNPSISIAYTSHSQNIGSYFRKVLVYLLRPFRTIDIVFSSEILNFYNKKNFKVIPNGIKTENYNLSIEKNEIFTFITVGRLEPVKNYLLLIDIISKLKIKDFQLFIVGDGYLREEIERKVENSNMSGKIKILGLREDIPELLCTAHCFLMPSSWEGMPIVILEAGSCGLPVISTPVGSIPTLIDNETGYLASLSDFHKTIEQVYNNYNEAVNKGNLLKQKIIKDYSIKTVVKEHEKIYLNCL